MQEGVYRATVGLLRENGGDTTQKLYRRSENSIELLRENGVDTTQFEKDAASIVNYGVMLTASTISNSSIAASGSGGTVSQVQKVP